MPINPSDTVAVTLAALEARILTLEGGPAPDTTAPTLSSPTAAKNGQTAMTGSVSTNEANGTLYRYISTSATPPSAANLKAGTGAVASGSQAVSSTGAQNVTASGLTADTAYYTYFLHRDAAGNDSAIAAAAAFTTDAAGFERTALTVVLADDYSAGEDLDIGITFPEAAGVYPSYFLREQVAGDAGFTVGLGGGGPIRDNNPGEKIELSWLAGGLPERAILAGQTAGSPTYYRCRLMRENDTGDGFVAASDWSNAVTATPAAVETASTLDPAKLLGTQSALSNANMTATATSAASAGSTYANGATQGRPGLRFFSVLMVGDAAGGVVGIGVVGDGYDYSKAQNDASNIAKRIIYFSNATCNRPDGSTVSSGLGSGVSTGSRLYCAYDIVAGLFWLGNDTGWKNGDPQAATGGYALPANSGFVTAIVTTQRHGSGQRGGTFEPISAGSLAKPARMSNYDAI